MYFGTINYMICSTGICQPFRVKAGVKKVLNLSSWVFWGVFRFTKNTKFLLKGRIRCIFRVFSGHV